MNKTRMRICLSASIHLRSRDALSSSNFAYAAIAMSAPSHRTPYTSSQPTVILGGGVLGLATAYYLARSLPSTSSSSPQVTVVDPATAPCVGSSSQCEGVIGTSGFPRQMQELGDLSWALFREFSDTHNGRQAFGHSPLTIHAVFSNRYDASDPRLPYPVRQEEDLSKLPRWLKTCRGWSAGLVEDGTRTAILDAPKFCDFLHSECKRLGVEFMMLSRVVGLHFTPDSRGLSAVDIEGRHPNDHDKGSPGQRKQIPCRSLVISAGAWSADLFSTLFPSALVSIHMAEKQPVQSWIRLDGNPTRQEVSSTENSRDRSHQVWLNALKDDFDFHASVLSEGGKLFVGGKIELGEQHPPLPDESRPDKDEVDELKTIVSDYIRADGESHLLSGRAYMPRTSLHRPFIARVPWDLLLPRNNLGNGGRTDEEELHHRDSNESGGVVLNFGHDLDGFTLSLASGKLAKQLILGEEPSIDIAPFNLPTNTQ